MKKPAQHPQQWLRLTFKNLNHSSTKPYWPNQALLTSRWTGQGMQSHVSLYCEQYGDEGSSNVGININFTKLNASQ